MSHSSPKLAAADSPSREQRIVNSHFFSPGPAETALWEKGLEHRRLVSNDPHVNLRVEQSRQFDNTPFQKIFDHMQEIAGLVIDDGNVPMPLETFSRLMRTFGVTNDFLLRRLFRIFDYKKQSFVGVLDFMAMIKVVLEGEYFTFFCAKIYQMLDIDSTGQASKRRLLGVPAKNGRGISDVQLAALKKWFADPAVPHANPDTFTQEELQKGIKTDRDMMHAFIGRIIEGMATVYANIDPPKPRKDRLVDYIEDRQRVPTAYDADAFLLAELEKVTSLTAASRLAGTEKPKPKKGGKGKKK